MSQKINKNHNGQLYIGALVLLILITAVIGLAVLSKQADQEVVSAQEETTKEIETTAKEKWQEGVIEYNGASYQFDSKIRTYLFMGIDQDGTAREAEDGISGGQSDAMFLLVIDDEKKTLSVIGINRNTMTDIDIYDVEGNYVDTENLQICLQHGYGDGLRVSCLRSVEAVSNLFYNLPISGYMSIRMDGIPGINDAVGGVEVTVIEDIHNDSLGVDLKQGETITLTGPEAYAYLRSRDLQEYDSASKRLDRQLQFMTAFLTKAKTLAAHNNSAAVQKYNDMKDYLVTNIEFAKFISEISDYEFSAADIYSVPGETFVSEKFEEYYVDADAFYDMIIHIFYKPVEEVE